MLGILVELKVLDGLLDIYTPKFKQRFIDLNIATELITFE